MKSDTQWVFNGEKHDTTAQTKAVGEQGGRGRGRETERSGETGRLHELVGQAAREEQPGEIEQPETALGTEQTCKVYISNMYIDRHTVHA